MHRSGTSVVARSLQCLGVALGERAIWSGPDNPTGFFEHQGVLAIDQHVMATMGVRWDDPDPIVALSLEAHLHPALRLIGEAAEQLIREELAHFGTFGIKEPRLCRLLPFWKPVLRRIGCEVSVVHVVRHPMAVARSLEKRNAIPVAQSLALWLEYVKRARSETDRRWKRVVVTYDSMVTFPAQEIARIGSALDLKMDEIGVRHFAKHFITDELWHETEEDNSALPMEVSILWQLMERESQT